MRTRLTSRLAFLLTILFLATAEIAVRVAYDPVEARSRFWFIAAGLLVMVSVMLAGQRWGISVLGPIALSAAAVAAVLGLYWILTFDWIVQGLDKYTLLQGVGLWIQAHRPVVPVPDDISSNVAGGGLAVLIPLGLGGVVWVWRVKHDWLWAGLGVIALLAATLVLVLTMSRGAWLGLGAGLAVFVYLIWRGDGKRLRAVVWAGDIGLLLIPLFLAGGFWLAVNFPHLGVYLGSVSGNESALGRVVLWRQGLDLIQDYPFTGAGLTSPMMALSSYVMLLHVGFIVYIHNLFLEIAVEQGIPALVIFLALMALSVSCLVGALRRGRHALVAGTAASLTALSVHGMVDSHGYYTKFVVLTFLILGFALGLEGAAPAQRRERRRTRSKETPEDDERSSDSSQRAPSRDSRIFPVAGSVMLALLLLLMLHPTARSLFQSNLGAVAQTQAELGVYVWPQWPIQDELRRSGTIELASALRRYEAALTLDPANPAANRRLGQIQLSLGAYEKAREHLAVAYAYAPQQQATRQLLAEAAAIAGDTDRSAALLRTVDTAQGQWQIRVWWYNHSGEPEIAQRLQDVERLATSPAQ